MSNILQPADGNSPRLNPFKNHSREPSRPASPASASATCASTPMLTPNPAPSTPGTSDTASDFPLSALTTASLGSATASENSMSQNASPSKRGPKLSDIVAKYAKDARPSSSSSEREGSVTGVSTDAPSTRGRLGLAGRLSRSNSTSSDLASSANVENEDPRPSGHESPAKQSAKKKALPSLEEIHERMQKKTLAATSTPPPESGVRPDRDANESLEAAKPKPDDAQPSEPASSETVSQLEAPIELPKEAAAIAEEQRVSDAWDIPQAGPSRPVPARDAFASLSPKRNSPILSTSSGSMGPPASTKPLSVQRGILGRPKATLAAPGSPSSSHAPIAQLGFSPEKRSPLLGSDSHPLQHKWCLYFDSKMLKSGAVTEGGGSDPWLPESEGAPNQGGASSSPSSPRSPRVQKGGACSSENWEATLKMVGAYRTVETFMGVFRSMKRPSQLDKSANYHLFKDNIKPMWEDPANAKGGKWIVSFSQGGTHPALLDRSWLWTVLALIGEDLDGDDEVTGAVLSARHKSDRIALWIRDKANIEQVNELGKRFVRMLELEHEPGVSLEFSVNNASGHSHRRGDNLSRQYWSFSNANRPRDSVSSGAHLGAQGAPHGGPGGPVRSALNSGSSGSGGGASMALGGPIGRVNTGGSGGSDSGRGMGLFGRTGPPASSLSSSVFGSSGASGKAW